MAEGAALTDSGPWRWRWRLGLAGAGLLVAVTVGARLSWPVTAAVVIWCWLPLVVWCLLARRTWPGLIGGVVLIAAIAAVLLALPGRPGDRSVQVVLPILALFSFAATLAVLIGRRWARGRPAGGSRRRLAVAALVTVVGLVDVGTWLAFASDGAPLPGAAELLPLPAPLALVGKPNTECGADGRSCGTWFTVAGPPGMGRDQVRQRVLRHLRRDKGWGPDTAGDDLCRLASRNNMDGWLTICVEFFYEKTPTVPTESATIEVCISTDEQWWSDGFPGYGRHDRS